MRKLLTVFFLLFSLFAIAQSPVNDDCVGLIDLGEAPWCDSTVFFTNLNATPSDIGNDNVPNIGNCAGLGEMDHDVWFSFIASDTILDYLITVTGITDGMGSTPMNMPQIAVYRGDCEFNGLEILECNAADLNENVVELELTGLDPGLPYYIRITDWSATAAPNWGTFQLCIIKKPPVVILDENIVTTLCSGEIYDSGGPDDDYGPNQNFTFTIAPQPAPACIIFTMHYYNIALSGTDAIRFYNGPNTSSPLLASITGGTTTGGGGVSYTVQANSGALTIQFISDGSLQFDGFFGSWECSTSPCDPPDLIQVTGTASEELIEDLIASAKTQVTITNIDCPDGAYGTFQQGDFTSLGLKEGLVLSSGRVSNAGGIGIPNPGNIFASTSWGANGDPDLDVLSTQFGGSLSNDACIVELDVYVADDELVFEYIFGSEEYPEFVNSSFNDIFALLISGPGIVGDPGLNGQKNMAVLPPPFNVPVQINSVNNQQNWEFYRNNALSTSVVYDGLTSGFLGTSASLTAKETVIPCNTYHLKFAIADRGDFSYDSGVFIADIKGGKPLLDVAFNNGIDYLVEGCTSLPDEIVLELSSEFDEEITYNVVVTGTAIPGIDYLLNIPSSITIPAGTVPQFIFPIVPLVDGLNEGTETIIIQLTNDFGCGDGVVAEVIIKLEDELAVDIISLTDTAYVCEGIGLQLEVTGAVDYTWTPAGVFTDPTGNTPFANPTSDTLVYVTGTLGLCTDTDSIFLDVIDPEVEIEAIGPIGICQGDTISLFAQNNVANSGLQWTANSTILDPLTSPTVDIAPLFNTTYTVKVELEGCSETDQITINVDPLTIPTLTFTDTVICQNYSVTLANQLSGVTTTYQWSANPSDPTLTTPNVSGPTVTPNVSTLYTLISTSQNAYCADTTTASVIVVPADVEVILPSADSLDICLGTTVNLTAFTSTGGPGFQWLPNDGTLGNPGSPSTTATPEVSTTYYAVLTVGGCTVFDSIHIRVDSIPFNEITQLIPDKESYCQGELITITSPNYEPANFPDIMHQWSPDVGFLTPDSLWNLVIQAVETTTYQRLTTNRACTDTASIEIIVIPTAFLSVTPNPAIICQGDSIQLIVNSDDPIDSYTWEPPIGLSCSDCPNPVASPPTTINYQIDGEFEGCPVGTNITVEVVTLPQILFPDAPTICPGDSISLNLATIDPAATYIWTINGNIVSNEPNPKVSPATTTTYNVIVQKPGCEGELQSVTVVVQNTPPVLTVSPDGIICIGDEITLTASANAPGTFLWSPGGDITESITVSPTTDSDYVVEFTSACYVLTETISIQVSPGFAADSITVVPPGEVFEGTSLTLQAFTTPAILTGPFYEWSLGQEIIGAGLNLNPFVTTAPGVDGEGQVFTYSVLITDAVGCAALVEVEVAVKNSEYEIPNVFTPDGDGVNDRFRVLKNEGVTVVEFRVFNRWGQKVYDNENGDQGWDGTHNGKPSASDAYAYFILIRNGDGAEIEEKGEITLIR